MEASFCSELFEHFDWSVKKAENNINATEILPK